MLALAAALSAGCEEDEPLPKLAKVPDFGLTDQSGETFRGSDLDGKVWIADFIFTNCPTYCPRLTKEMGELRERLSEHRDAVQFVSISVDPENDTPDVLRKYAKEHDAAYPNWTFLTGPTKTVTDVVVEGFKAPMGEPQPKEKEDVYTILHARHFVLVDGNRRIRGYYRTEPKQLDQLVQDVQRLLEQQGASQ